MNQDEERLAELLAEKETRDAERRAVMQRRKVEVLELEAKYEAELGPRGEQFEIVETLEGPIVVKLGPGVLLKRLQGTKVTEVDVRNFVVPQLAEPAADVYDARVAKRGGIADACLEALLSLHNIELGTRRGK